MLITSLCFTFPTRTWAKDIFEKTKWTVEVEPDDDAQKAGGKKFEDTISFKGNKLESKELKKKGFEPAAYEGDVRGGAIGTFKSTLTSDKEGKIEWSGTITGRDMIGDLTWTKKDGTVLKYSFKGTKED
jgi:hypothetical protein